MSKLRFLFVSSDRFPPFRVDVEVLFGREFAQRGHQIDWLLQSEEARATPGEVEWRGWRVFVGAMDAGERFVNRLRKHLMALRNELRVPGLIRDNDYDFVQVKDKFLVALLAMRAARKKGCGFVFWLSYPFPEASLYGAKMGTARYPWLYRIRGSIFHYLLYRIIAPRADHLFVQSEQMKRDMAAKGVPPSKMTPVLMGFLPAEDAPQPVPIKPNQMVYLGTLLKYRKLDFLVGVLARVRERVPDATLLMIGPEELPGDMQVLREAAQRAGVEDALTLTGRMPREQAFERVAASAVCFSPFYPTPILNSTSPTKLVEYFSLKKAAVANDHPEQKQVLEESGGGICVGWDEAAFADAAIEIMQDPERARQMGERGYAYAMANRTYRVIADQVEQKYLALYPKAPSGAAGSQA
ncbi:MAG: glycosyltransferase [Pseudomonadota bacterium]